jgi:hypothetical protein
LRFPSSSIWLQSNIGTSLTKMSSLSLAQPHSPGKISRPPTSPLLSTVAARIGTIQSSLSNGQKSLSLPVKPPATIQQILPQSSTKKRLAQDHSSNDSGELQCADKDSDLVLVDAPTSEHSDDFIVVSTADSSGYPGSSGF